MSLRADKIFFSKIVRALGTDSLCWAAAGGRRSKQTTRQAQRPLGCEVVHISQKHRVSNFPEKFFALEISGKFRKIPENFGNDLEKLKFLRFSYKCLCRTIIHRLINYRCLLCILVFPAVIEPINCYYPCSYDYTVCFAWIWDAVDALTGKETLNGPGRGNSVSIAVVVVLVEAGCQGTVSK